MTDLAVNRTQILQQTRFESSHVEVRCEPSQNRPNRFVYRYKYY